MSTKQPDSLTGRDLEAWGHRVLDRLGLSCVYPLPQVRLIDIVPDSSASASEHCEIDYLIIHNDRALLGEITSRVPDRNLRRKYAKFRQAVDAIRSVRSKVGTWRQLGVPEALLSQCHHISEVYGFMVMPYVTPHDVQLDEANRIICLYENDWRILGSYADTIESFGINAFLHLFGIPPPRATTLLHRPVLYTLDRRIGESDLQRASLCTFEASPYELLPIASVHRRDLLPDLSPESLSYQRPLLPAKLKTIRDKLLSKPNFVFPNPILAVLSNTCVVRNEPNGETTLQIPNQYGAISVLDGQHRLFSYATKAVQSAIGSNASILVTGILFEEADEDIRMRLSARTFVEINSNQTKIAPTHIDAIAYSVLNETTPRALAAEVILRVNRLRDRPGFGLFQTNQTLQGIIPATTVLGAIRPIVNLDTVRAVAGSTVSRHTRHARGYKALLGSSAEELIDPEALVKAATSAVSRYLYELQHAFPSDWNAILTLPPRTSFRFAKFLAAWIRLLSTFVKEGLSWDEIREDLAKIKANVGHLQRRRQSNISFAPTAAAIPNAEYSEADILRFLKANRTKAVAAPTLRSRRRRRR